MSYLQLSGTPLSGTGGYGRIGRPSAVGIDANQGVTVPLWLLAIGGAAALGWLMGRKKRGRRSRNRLLRSAERLVSGRHKLLPRVYVIKVQGREKPYRHRTMKAVDERLARLRKAGIPYDVEVVHDPKEPGGK